MIVIIHTLFFSDKENLDDYECAVCLQPCVHPVKLPCSHIFCYLCVKGVANRSRKCALCRTAIPPDFVNKPQLLCKKDVLNSSALEDGTQWFYAGNNSGWWKYDPRTNKDIEDKYTEGIKKFEILIAGFLYVIDFEQMVQYRHTDTNKKRSIKRDHEHKIPTKGVAGLIHNKEDDSVERESADGDGDADSLTSLTTPQTTPIPLATATPADLSNNNRSLGFPSPITHLSPQSMDTRRHSTPTEASSAAGGNGNDSFIARMRDMQLGDNNPRHFIPRRGMGNSESAMRRRRRREQDSFTSLRRISTDSDDSD
jgi:E3 ubiquitin-protein ligase RNF146